MFKYRVYIKEKDVIVKLHIDYLKQYSSVAFPTPIFLEQKEKYSTINYKITSKNNPELVTGELKVIRENTK